jgi:uncharacterized membrane protein
MPTDTAARSQVVAAPFDAVLATIRAVDTQPTWVKEILEAEVLEEYEGGLPATARFRASTPVGTDAYTLAYEHGDDGMTWSLVEGRLQSGQDAEYRLRPVDDDHTEVQFQLTIRHGLPLPGFVRSRVIKGLVNSTVDGLQARVEG